MALAVKLQSTRSLVVAMFAAFRRGQRRRGGPPKPSSARLEAGPKTGVRSSCFVSPRLPVWARRTISSNWTNQQGAGHTFTSQHATDQLLTNNSQTVTRPNNLTPFNQPGLTRETANYRGRSHGLIIGEGLSSRKDAIRA